MAEEEKRGKREITTIKISKSTVSLLNELKIHPRQSYEEVIIELLEKNKQAIQKTRGVR